MKKKIILGVVFPMILLLSIVSCKNNNSANGHKGEEMSENVILEDETDKDEELTYEVIHSNMSYFNFDNVKDLASFFKDIESKHERPVFFEEETPTVDKCISQIEKYRNGTCKYYPDSLVRESLSYLGLSAAGIDNHGPGVDLTYAERFMMLVAYYSPDITYMVDMQSPDHLVGVRNFGQEYSYSHSWPYLFVKRTKGYEVRAINKDNCYISQLYQLEDTSHRKYYLCSSNITDTELSFMHYLYMFDRNEKLIEIKLENGIRFPDVDYDEIYFNPKSLEWTLCKENKKSGKLIPVTKEPLMKLELKGEESELKIFGNGAECGA